MEEKKLTQLEYDIFKGEIYLAIKTRLEKGFQGENLVDAALQYILSQIVFSMLDNCENEEQFEEEAKNLNERIRKIIISSMKQNEEFKSKKFN